MNKVLICVAFASAMLSAQTPAAPQKMNQAIPAAQVMERIQESILDDEPQMRMMGALPAAACSPKPRVILLGKDDNFNPLGSEPIFLSPTAKAVWGSKLVPFDYPGMDRVFAASFNLGQCKLCGQRVMTVEIKVKRFVIGRGEQSDRAYVHFSNGALNATGLSSPVPVVDIWKNVPNNVTTKVITFQIPLSAVNAYIFANNSAFLDVVVQDETAVDYVKLTW